MCVISHLMELWATLFAGCEKADFAFSCAVNSVVHGGMGSYAYFHNAFGIVKRKEESIGCAASWPEDSSFFI